MKGFETRKPAQLSGGQQQRIALARSLVFDPELVLMDEPLGALDKQLREHMQYEIKQLHQKLGVTVVYVTHDQSEALTMSNRVAVFNDGVIQQLSSPEGLYENPENSFVAQFIGENNRFYGKIDSVVKGEVVVKTENDLILRAKKVNCGDVGSKTTLSIRPERVFMGEKYKNKVNAVVEQLIYHGDHIRCRLSINQNNEFIVKISNSNFKKDISVGKKVVLSWDTKDCHALDA